MKLVNVAIVVFISLFIMIPSVLAVSPNTINYQGYLTNSTGDALDGTYNLTFTIFDAATGGNSKWTESHNGVVVNNGLFTLVLGSLYPILDTVFSGQDRYLQIRVGLQDISPRTLITASAYSQKVSTVDGATGGTIDGGIIIVPDNFIDPANALDVRDLSDNSVVTITVTSTSAAFMDFYDPVDTKDGNAFGSHYARLGKNGLQFFNSISGDTVLSIEPNGSIFSTGQVVVGQNSSNSGLWATSFGYSNQATGDTSTISGGSSNIASGALSAISGGGNNNASQFATVIGGGQNNSSLGAYATVSGGLSNTSSGYASTVAGGYANGTSGDYSAMGGGYLGEIIGNYSSIVGGYGNAVHGANSSIGGGFYNYINGPSYSMIPGGYKNNITGNFAFAAGSGAYASNDGCFVWSDAADTGFTFSSTGNNQFLINAAGGVGIGTNNPGSAQLKVQTSKAYGGEFSTDLGSSAARAIYGHYDGTTALDGQGVYGYSVPVDYYGYGGRFQGGYRGVLGEMYPTGTGSYIAVYGYNSGSLTSGSKYGVNGTASGTGTTNYGVYGSASGATTNYAGYFNGNVSITGTISKGGGSFKIDHPLDPAHKYLYHSFVESPDMMNVYNGNIVLGSDGTAVVTMPDYFTALNKDFRYQLTCIGGFAPVYISQEIKDNQFVIAGGEAGMKVSWQVTGIRQDPFANAHRIPVEENKTGDEYGKYLYPEVYGKSNVQGIDAAREAKNNERLEKNNP